MSERLSNDDFRKLLMTPRGTMIKVPETPSRTTRKFKFRKQQTPKDENNDRLNKKKTDSDQEEEEKTRLELAMKYRDRAQERRMGLISDPMDVSQSVPPSSQGMNEISKVAIGIPNTIDESEKIKQISGSTSYSHLVKGLDYALLYRIKSQQKQQIDSNELPTHEPQNNIPKKETEDEEMITFTTILGKNIHNILFTSLAENIAKLHHERLAYVFNLDEDYVESQIPTSLFRSKSEVSSLETKNIVSTNDIVIQKLSHILSYLRHGKPNKKIQTKQTTTIELEIENKNNDEPISCSDIYDDIGTYDSSEALSKRKSQISSTIKSGSYFDQPTTQIAEENIEKSNVCTPSLPQSAFLAVIENDGLNSIKTLASEARMNKYKTLNNMENSYAECYPGAVEMEDATQDSDEDDNHSRVDPSKKRNIPKKWDFDNEEEYGKYLEKIEAPPKAAFQYGIKASNGRKTRRKQAEKEKAKLDKQWNSISKIINKRKSDKQHDGFQNKIKK